MSSLLCSLLLRRDQQDGEHTKTHRGYPLSLWHLLRLNLSQTKPHCRPLRKREEGQKRARGCVPRILYIFVGLFVMSIRNAWHSFPSLSIVCCLWQAGQTCWGSYSTVFITAFTSLITMSTPSLYICIDQGPLTLPWSSRHKICFRMWAIASSGRFHKATPRLHVG